MAILGVQILTPPQARTPTALSFPEISFNQLLSFNISLSRLSDDSRVKEVGSSFLGRESLCRAFGSLRYTRACSSALARECWSGCEAAAGPSHGMGRAKGGGGGKEQTWLLKFMHRPFHSDIIYEHILTCLRFIQLSNHGAVYFHQAFIKLLLCVVVLDEVYVCQWCFYGFLDLIKKRKPLDEVVCLVFFWFFPES